MNPDHERTSTPLNELEEAGELLADDLQEEVRARMMRSHRVKQRISAGLTDDGKRLKRNARCPCGSGKKFKKCCLHNVKLQVGENVQPYLNSRIERFSTHEDCNQHEHGDTGRIDGNVEDAEGTGDESSIREEGKASQQFDHIDRADRIRPGKGHRSHVR